MSRRIPPGAGQLQLSASVHGTVNPAAGERAKTRGMAAAQAHTPSTWASDCDQAIRTMAGRGVTFQAADLIAEGLVGEPPLPAQWGPRFAKAANDGVIEFVDHAPSKRATVHRSICKQWRGTETYRGRGAA